MFVSSVFNARHGNYFGKQSNKFVQSASSILSIPQLWHTSKTSHIIAQGVSQLIKLFVFMWFIVLLYASSCSMMFGVNATMSFTTPNVLQASLYQSVQIGLTSNRVVNDPAITSNDRIYFIVNTSSSTPTSCSYFPRDSTTTQTTFNVTSTSTTGVTGTAMALITSNLFSSGLAYDICYLSEVNQRAIVLKRASSVLSSNSLFIWPPLYTSYNLFPSLPHGGQGMVNLTMHQAQQENRPINVGLSNEYSAFMVACSGNTYQMNCTSLDSMTQSCARIGSTVYSNTASSSSEEELVILTNIRGAGSLDVTGGFTVPYTPSVNKYALCIPYCGSSDGQCTLFTSASQLSEEQWELEKDTNEKSENEEKLFKEIILKSKQDENAYMSLSLLADSDTVMSFTTLAVSPFTTPPENSLLTFAEANPLTYSTLPVNPQAHENGWIMLTGSSLNISGDGIKIIRQDQSCTSASPSLLTNIRVGPLLNAASDEGSIITNAVNVSFYVPSLINSPMRGKICYYNSNSQLWSTVRRSASSGDVADLVITPLQPSSFMVQPANAHVGQTITLTLIGTGLNASLDRAFLRDVSSFTNNADNTASDATSTASSSIQAGDSVCDETSSSNRYNCTLSVSSSSSSSSSQVICKVQVDPLLINHAMTLAICYRKVDSLNYAELNNSVSLLSRNPTYDLSPSTPIFAGQTVQMQFYGNGLGAHDVIRFVNASNSSSGVIDCATSTPIAGIDLVYSNEVLAQQQYNYSLLGQGDLCVRVCYQFAGSSEWIIARASTTSSSSSSSEEENDNTNDNVLAPNSCSNGDLYISNYEMRYNFSLPSNTQVQSQETIEMALLVPSSSSSSSSTSSINVNAIEPWKDIAAVKLIRAPDACVLTRCAGLAACAQANLSSDYADSVNSVNNNVNVQDGFVSLKRALIAAGAANTNYIVCVLPSQYIGTSNPNAYIPVHSIVNDNVFGFTTTLASPVLHSYLPAPWRVSMSTLSSVFVGNSLNSSRDTVYAFNASQMLFINSASNAHVCPSLTQATSRNTALISQFHGPNGSANETSTEVLVDYTNSNFVLTGTTIYLCYVWSMNSNINRMGYTGSITLSESTPVNMSLVDVPLDSEGNVNMYKAGDPYTLSFSSNTSTGLLSTDNDEIYLYAFAQTTTTDSSSSSSSSSAQGNTKSVQDGNIDNCYCNPAQCTSGTLITSATLQQDGARFVTDRSSEFQTVYFNPRGFTNYGRAMRYVVCYRVAALQANNDNNNNKVDTYMGEISVAMANPAYYTNTTTDVSSGNAIGKPFTITAVSLCTSNSNNNNCAPLSVNDEMILINSSTRCGEVYNASDQSQSITLIGSPRVSSGGGSFAQMFVANAMDNYTVCFRLNNSHSASGMRPFGELMTYVSSSSSSSSLVFRRQRIIVQEADPVNWNSIPTSLSASQFLTINLICSQAMCGTCTTLRLVPGALASCWTNVPNTISSDDCVLNTEIQFPNAWLIEGAYTLCYGEQLNGARRVPYALMVSPYNPSNYTPSALTNTNNIYTNQNSNFTLVIQGNGLSTSDSVFILPAKYYNCHDLQKDVIYNNGTLSRWLAPSFNPYPLTLQNENTIVWTVSNRNKLFGTGMLNDSSLCPGNNEPCPLQLCYRRSGQTWSNVPFVSSSNDEEEEQQQTSNNSLMLVAGNPSSATFDQPQFVVNMYTLVTVRGANLLANDTLYIQQNDCTGDNVSVFVGSAEVSKDGTVWRGVIRFTEPPTISTTNNNDYAVCYYRNTLTQREATEIVDITIPGQATSTITIFNSPLRFVLSASNFTSFNVALHQYEEMIVTATYDTITTTTTNSNINLVDLTSTQLIDGQSGLVECNYEPFYNNINNNPSSLISRFPVLVNFTPMADVITPSQVNFAGRLDVPAGNYALCMTTQTGILFRVVQTPLISKTSSEIEVNNNMIINAKIDSIVVHSPLPFRYNSTPRQPMPGQTVSLTFTLDNSDSSSSSEFSVNTLRVNDLIEIIDGDHYSCGFDNITHIAYTTISEVKVNSSTQEVISATASFSIDASLSPSYIDVTNLTVCYRTQNATFATVPRVVIIVDDSSSVSIPIDNTEANEIVQIDRNFKITAPQPTFWSSIPAEVEVNVPFTITFNRSTSNVDFLSVNDKAFLVFTGITPPSTESNNICNVSNAILVSSSLTLDAQSNIVWSIPAYSLSQVGEYVVCYIAQANGMPLYVNKPPYLSLVQQQSPFAIYTNREFTEPIQVDHGERFYLFFNSSDTLNLTLEENADDGNNQDVVRFSSSVDCQTPLSAGTIVSIPAEYAFAPLDVINTTSKLPIPYLHLRARLPSSSGIITSAMGYVCLRRANRLPNEVYYNFTVVGTILTPSLINITLPPLLNFSSLPTLPRAMVPRTLFTLEYNTNNGNVMSSTNLSQVFFVRFRGSSGSAVNEITFDDCYRANQTEAKAGTPVQDLLNTTLQLTLTSQSNAEQQEEEFATLYPFPQAGSYLMCYQLLHRFPAAVLPTMETVLNLSPSSYVVPRIIASGSSFTLTINSIDNIFVTGQNHEAQLYQVPENDQSINSGNDNSGLYDGVPLCTGVTPPSGGISHFTSFNALSVIQATIQPELMNAGYYYLCFKTSGQLNFFAVPLANSNSQVYIFPVGLTGAQQYQVIPQPAYMGQELLITIIGSQLSSADHVKVVDITSSFTSTGNINTDYNSWCNASATNADAHEPNGPAGSQVNTSSAILANYLPIINSTGQFILCYQSVILGNSWSYIARVPYFNVSVAVPTGYNVTPKPTYERSISTLVIHDTHLGNVPGILSSLDTLKFVDRTESTGKPYNFDCTRAAQTSSKLNIVEFVSSQSNSSANVYRVCGKVPAYVTLCYAFASSDNVNDNNNNKIWAEVPLHSPPPSYEFAGLTTHEDPFTGPIITFPVKQSSTFVPRPFEPFTFTFTSNEANVQVTQIAFATAPVTPCSLNIPFIEPNYEEAMSSQRNTFRVALAQRGSYSLFLNTYNDSNTQVISREEFMLHDNTLTIGSCDPCSAFPPYFYLSPQFVSFTENNNNPSSASSSSSSSSSSSETENTNTNVNVNADNVDVLELTFPSATQYSLGSSDALRLIPSSQGVNQLPCETPTGPFAPYTYSPTRVNANGNSTVFTIPINMTDPSILASVPGEYYLCYRKGNDKEGAFALVVDEESVLVTLQLFNSSIGAFAADTCPGGNNDDNSVFAMETIVMNLTAAEPNVHPAIRFNSNDQLALIPTSLLIPSSSQNTNSDISEKLLCEKYNTSTQTAKDSSTGLLFATMERYGIGFANFYLTLPSLRNSTNYTFCYKGEYDTHFRSIFNKSSITNSNVNNALILTEVVNVANPNGFTTSPPVILPSSNDVIISITGQSLQTTDEVFIVNSTEDCAETCDKPLQPVPWNKVTHRISFVDSSLVQVRFNGPIGEEVNLAVCYRRTNQYLFKLGNIIVGNPNPEFYTTNFLPRVGTQPLITFTGHNLSSGDVMMIVNNNMACLESNAIATGQFAQVLSTSSITGEMNSVFTLSLVNVPIGTYTMCYQVARTFTTINGYVVVSPRFVVSAGGPNAITTSNQVMLGRATEIHFVESALFVVQNGDSAYIACPTCSCFDNSVALLPYGQANVTFDKSTQTIFTLRVGFSNTDNNNNAAQTVLSYPVCYRIAGSGYALVTFITPTLNDPIKLTWIPIPTYQGQRLHMNFTSNNQSSSSLVEEVSSTMLLLEPLTINDQAMLVDASRECWDRPDLNNKNIYVEPRNITNVINISTTSESEKEFELIAQWNGHVPSLGPNTPPTSLFPLSYVLCYRSGVQREYVAVPFPTLSANLMQSASPASFITSPVTITRGIIDATLTVQDMVVRNGDEAYIVQFNTLTNNVCDVNSSSSSVNSNSWVISPQVSAFPSLTFSIPGNALIGDNNTVLCYIRANATVAEVPQLLQLTVGNPHNYTTNITDTIDNKARERMYIAFNVSGVQLNASTDRVVFTRTPCSEASRPFTSTTALRRMSDLENIITSANSSIYFVAQFIKEEKEEDTSETLTVYMCYYTAYDNIWSEVGSPLILFPAEPVKVIVMTSQSSSIPRAGQHILITLDNSNSNTNSLVNSDNSLITQDRPLIADVISGNDAQRGSWCHNYTSTQILQPFLKITNAVMLDVAMWTFNASNSSQVDQSRLCLYLSQGAPWRDVGQESHLELLPPIAAANPLHMTSFPEIIHVGEQVTLEFELIVEPSLKDGVKITQENWSTPCDMARSVNGFNDFMPITSIMHDNHTSITLIDSNDAFAYRSFNTSGDYRVCYYSFTESVWSAIGGTVERSTLHVEPQIPNEWTLYSGELTLGLPFVLNFSVINTTIISDVASSLEEITNTKLDPVNDKAWMAPIDQSCGVDPMTCTKCVLFSFNASLSSSESVITNVNRSHIAGEMHLCYQLAQGTASLLSLPLTIGLGPIECVNNNSVMIGRRQIVQFRKRMNESVSSDSWRVSFFAIDGTSCESHFSPDFINGRALQVNYTNTTVSYSVEWPVALNTSQYTICYQHNNIYAPICTCGQIDAESGECYMSVEAGNPLSVQIAPTPSYVGQTFTLNLLLNPSWPTLTTDVPIDVKMVKYVDALTSCLNEPAFNTSNGILAAYNTTMYTFTFKHDYLLPPSSLLVCVRTALTTPVLIPSSASSSQDETDIASTYSRVGLYIPDASYPNGGDANTFNIRPYLTLTTFPMNVSYLRAMQLINFTFTHQSHLHDDIVSISDSFTFVSDPMQCNESYIEGEQNVPQVMSMFVLDDTGFLTLPANVRQANQTIWSSSSFATFNSSIPASITTHYLCYKLSHGGTWSVILPSFTIFPAFTSNCSLTLPLSPANANTSSASGGDVGNELRAMQFIRTTIIGAFDLPAYYSMRDEVRIVPQHAICTDDTAVVFTNNIYVNSLTNTNVSTITFAPNAGLYKLCYRFYNSTSFITNWSPTCPFISLVNASPIAESLGCIGAGQSLDVNVTHNNNNNNNAFQFTSNDLVRFVSTSKDNFASHGNRVIPCLNADGSSILSSSSITVNDTSQPDNGFPVITSSQSTNNAGGFVTLPYAFMGSATQNIQLCYRDSAGNEFAIPLSFSTQPTVAAFALQPRQPMAMSLLTPSPQLGQRLLMNFTSTPNSNSESKILSLSFTSSTVPFTPFAPLPNPFVPAPLFNGSFDAAGMLRFSTSSSYFTNVYKEGRCAALMHLGNNDDKQQLQNALHGVYGPPSTSTNSNSNTNNNVFVPYTIGNYDPMNTGVYITCYQLASCQVTDSGSPFWIRSYNPASTRIIPSLPRRGQILRVMYDHDGTSSDVTPFTPLVDRATLAANLNSCWSLNGFNDNPQGQLVNGTSVETFIAVFFSALSPSLPSASTSTRSCYELGGNGGLWSEIPQNIFTIAPANPARFSTVPDLARQMQLTLLQLHGTGFGIRDRVKIITSSANCSDESIPPSFITAYGINTSSNGVNNAKIVNLVPWNAVDGNGWPIAAVSSDGTLSSINVSSSMMGSFSVCYKLASDTVWTLVYDQLTFLERIPNDVIQTPVSTLEGELFTLNFTSTSTSTSTNTNAAGALGNVLTSSDKVVLFFGENISCVSPDEETTRIEGDPTSTEFLPRSIAFTLSAGTRGNYTLCYYLAVSSTSSTISSAKVERTPVWGFPQITVQPNPTSVALMLAENQQLISSSSLRTQELITLVFIGFGLANDNAQNLHDEVKLIDGNTAPSDARCRTENSFDASSDSSIIYYYPLKANGTFAVQTLRQTQSSNNNNNKYWICYKLNGGEYHFINLNSTSGNNNNNNQNADSPNPLQIIGNANPSSATSIKLGKTFYDGENVNWTVINNSACTANQDVLYYSSNECNDVPEYVHYTNNKNVLPLELFPLGATRVKTCSNTQNVSYLVQLAMNATDILAANSENNKEKVSLCYYAAADSSFNMLVEDGINVQVGTPAPLPPPSSSSEQIIVAERIINFTLPNFVPALTDYVVFVSDPSLCVGISAPSDSALATFTQYNSSTSTLHVFTSFASSGTYFMCYSHQAGDGCAANVIGLECARIIAQVDVQDAFPGNWRVRPSPLFASDSLEVTFQPNSRTRSVQLTTGSSSTIQETLANVWMVMFTTNTSDSVLPQLTMKDVMNACDNNISSRNMNVNEVGERIDLQYNSSTLTWTALNVNNSGRYALCTNITQINSQSNINVNTEIGIFSPINNAGPVMLPSYVNDISFPRMPMIGEVTNILLQGHGLSYSDWVFAVALPSSSLSSLTDIIVPADICTNTSYQPRVNSSTSSSTGNNKNVGLNSMLRQFMFTLSTNYVLCYADGKDNSLRVHTPVLVNSIPFIVSPAIYRVSNVGPASLAHVPMTFEFIGSSLSANNVAALIAVPSNYVNLQSELHTSPFKETFEVFKENNNVLGDLANEERSTYHYLHLLLDDFTSSSSNICDQEGISYTRMSSVSSDGTSSLITLTPTHDGIYAMCFKAEDVNRQVYIPSLLLPERFNVHNRTAIAVAFTTQLSGCAMNSICTIQPTLTLLNASSLPTSDPGATVNLTLLYENGALAPQNFLLNSHVYNNIKDSSFNFTSIAITTPGTYYLRGDVYLLGNVHLQTQSLLVEVSDGPTPTPPPSQNVSELQCTPSDFVSEENNNNNNVIMCRVRSLVTPPPHNYSINVNVGTATACISNTLSQNENGLINTDNDNDNNAMCNFTVTAPSRSEILNPYINAIVINVLPLSPYETNHVANSPMMVFIPTVPSTSSTIACVHLNRTISNSEDDVKPLPDLPLVRSNSGLNCTLQGKAMINNVLTDIAALPNAFSVWITFVDEILNRNANQLSSSSSSSMVELPAKPATQSGSYQFIIPAHPAWNMSVNASIVILSSNNNVNNRLQAESNAIVGSPQNFTVIDAPSSSTSSVACYSSITQSQRWFTPQSQLNCTLTLRNASNAHIHGIVQDYEMSLLNGGLVNLPASTFVSDVVPFNLTVPAMPQTSNSKVKEALLDRINALQENDEQEETVNNSLLQKVTKQIQMYTASVITSSKALLTRMVSLQASTFNNTFGLDITYIPSSVKLTSFQGIQLYVSEIVSPLPAFIAQQPVALQLLGSGLDSRHNYTFNTVRSCDAIPSYSLQAMNDAGKLGQVRLSLSRVPKVNSLFLCVMPYDAENVENINEKHSFLLLSQRFDIQGSSDISGNTGWSSDDLALLIVGVIFLVILLVVLLILLWRLCCVRLRNKNKKENEMGVDNEHRQLLNSASTNTESTSRVISTSARHSSDISTNATTSNNNNHQIINENNDVENVYMPPRANDRFLYRLHYNNNNNYNDIQSISATNSRLETQTTQLPVNLTVPQDQELHVPLSTHSQSNAHNNGENYRSNRQVMQENNNHNSISGERSAGGVTTTHVKVNIHDNDQGKVHVHEKVFSSQYSQRASQSNVHKHKKTKNSNNGNTNAIFGSSSTATTTTTTNSTSSSSSTLASKLPNNEIKTKNGNNSRSSSYIYSTEMTSTNELNAPHSRHESEQSKHSRHHHHRHHHHRSNSKHSNSNNKNNKINKVKLSKADQGVNMNRENETSKYIDLDAHLANVANQIPSYRPLQLNNNIGSVINNNKKDDESESSYSGYYSESGSHSHSQSYSTSKTSSLPPPPPLRRTVPNASPEQITQNTQQKQEKDEKHKKSSSHHNSRKHKNTHHGHKHSHRRHHSQSHSYSSPSTISTSSYPSYTSTLENTNQSNTMVSSVNQLHAPIAPPPPLPNRTNNNNLPPLIPVTPNQTRSSSVPPPIAVPIPLAPVSPVQLNKASTEDVNQNKNEVVQSNTNNVNINNVNANANMQPIAGPYQHLHYPNVRNSDNNSITPKSSSSSSKASSNNKDVKDDTNIHKSLSQSHIQPTNSSVNEENLVGPLEVTGHTSRSMSRSRHNSMIK